MQRVSIVAACVVLVLALGASAAEEAKQVPNPAYEAWSKFKVGSSTTFAATMKMKGDAAAQMPGGNMTNTVKLVDLSPEKAVIELTASIDMGGQKMDMPARRQDIPAKIAADQADRAKFMLPPDQKGSVTDIQEGEEEIAVMDKKLKCKTMSAKVKQDGREMTVKSWTSSEIPGQVVQTQIESKEMDMTMKLTGYEVGK